ncbi:hypothetical protein [Telmatospirillum sp. J64-1]|uniref:hypothetical protein n=1 Tax=Telmatospirillum sp. J64-1 TaxID=2502183 RepID=UPI00115D371D|nr:hypothetical protein [Telmatospirillum sp. J64-1]
MAVATLPPPIDIKAETKKVLIDGIKKVLDLYKAKGLVDKSIGYGDLIGEPKALHAFIQAYRSHPEVADSIVMSPEKKPVREDGAMLLCGVTLEQVQQLLVKTCARKYYERDLVTETVEETVTTRRFLFFTKTEVVERKATSGDERKIRELLKYLAFDWQLPLLDAYREHLSLIHLMELDQDILALHTPEAVAIIGNCEPSVLKKAKEISGRDFSSLIEQPQALVGAVNWNRDMYMFFRNALGPKSWDFFSREKSFFNTVAALDKPTARVYGDVLAYIASENLQEMQRLNIDKADVLVQSLKATYSDMLPLILGQPSFAKELLRKLVDSLLHMSQEKDQLLVSTQLTCKAMMPQVKDWLMKTRAAS